jgi:hypothetical protein
MSVQTRPCRASSSASRSWSLAGEHQPQQVRAAAADDEHRPVLAAAVALVVGHPRPHDLAGIGPSVGARAVLHVGGAGRARAGGGADQPRHPTDPPEDASVADHSGTVRAPEARHGPPWTPGDVDPKRHL